MTRATCGCGMCMHACTCTCACSCSMCEWYIARCCTLYVWFACKLNFICIYVCVCVCVSVYLCICVSVYLCTCMCRYLTVCIYIHTRIDLKRGIVAILHSSDFIVIIVLLFAFQTAVVPSIGVYVFGLFLDGACWDYKYNILAKLPFGRRISTLPEIHFFPENVSKSDMHEVCTLMFLHENL